MTGIIYREDAILRALAHLEEIFNDEAREKDRIDAAHSVRGILIREGVSLGGRDLEMKPVPYTPQAKLDKIFLRSPWP